MVLVNENAATLYVFLLVAMTACLICFTFAAMKIYDMTGVEIDFGHKRFSYEEQRLVELNTSEFVHYLNINQQVYDLFSPFHPHYCYLGHRDLRFWIHRILRVTHHCWHFSLHASNIDVHHTCAKEKFKRNRHKKYLLLLKVLNFDCLSHKMWN